MTREWQPGDVAMVTERLDYRGAQDAWIAAKDDKGWASLDPRIGWISDSDVLTARPLVVIDPEDREQVQQFTTALRRAEIVLSHTPSRETVQVALREFAELKPPPCGAALTVTYSDGKGHDSRCHEPQGHDGPHVTGDFRWTANYGVAS